MIVQWNGQRQNSAEAVIPVYDHGFLYGMGVFETFRTYGGGKVWLANRHAARLTEACAMLGIRYAVDAARLEREAAELLAANGLADGYVRWSVSAGVGDIGLRIAPYETPNEIVYVKPLAADEPATRPGKPLRLLHLPRSAPETGSDKPRLKSFHYMNNMAAKKELVETGAAPNAEGLFLDGRGYVCEGLVSNVFWLKDGALHTPSLEAGPLPGITRGFVLELARDRFRLPVREGLYRWEQIWEADELFLTNSVQEIVPVTTLEATTFASRALPVGPATARFMHAYREAALEGREP